MQVFHWFYSEMFQQMYLQQIFVLLILKLQQK